MKIKNFSVSVGLVGTMSMTMTVVMAMLVIALASVANIAAAQDAPPTISNPFGSSSSTTPPPSDTAPPALTIKPKPAAPATPPVTPPAAPIQELTTPPPLTPPSLVTEPVIPVIQDYETGTDLPAAPDTTGGKLPKTGPETGLMFLASMAGSVVWKKFRRHINK